MKNRYESGNAVLGVLAGLGLLGTSFLAILLIGPKWLGSFPHFSHTWFLRFSQYVLPLCALVSVMLLVLAVAPMLTKIRKLSRGTWFFALFALLGVGLVMLSMYIMKDTVGFAWVKQLFGHPIIGIVVLSAFAAAVCTAVGAVELSTAV